MLDPAAAHSPCFATALSLRLGEHDGVAQGGEAVSRLFAGAQVSVDAELEPA